MDYLKHYKLLIRKTKKRGPLICYTEKHHIIPKCFLKHKKSKIVNASWNIVNLTPREHFIAHKLLYKHFLKLYGSNHRKTKQSFLAWSGMAKNTNERNLSARQHQDLKIKMTKFFSGKNNPRYNNPHTQQSKQKMSRSAKARGSNRTGKTHSKETKIKMSHSQKGNKNCLGRVMSPETRLKISLSQKARHSKNKN